MSETEEERFCYYGKPLEQFDEDAFPKKRPISVEEQIATDSHGRRRFHGAFTGGFSAGFFNTVGSLEGWLPSDFKSSRQEKSKNVVQRPEDYMDDEDIGEFGIAHQTVKATDSFSLSTAKRKRPIFIDGPIPGEPVLHTLITSGNETIGHLLLKNIGIKEKIKVSEQERASSSSSRMYGCEMPTLQDAPTVLKHKQYEIDQIYKDSLANPKINTFGLGYVGLDRTHINLFKSTSLVVKEKDKKLSINGQAFGVGAFEADDDDIYEKDDMNKYDFELVGEKEARKQKKKLKPKETVLDLFVKSKGKYTLQETYAPPVIPHSFTGKYKLKKSRFEPLKETIPTPKRKDLNPTIRAGYLGEASQQNSTPSNQQFVTSNAADDNARNETKVKEEDVDSNNGVSEAILKKYAPDLILDRFVSSSQNEDTASSVRDPVKRTETEHGTKELRDAAKFKMFGPLTRIQQDWQPCALLCKRFDVPELLHDGSSLNKNKKRTKHLIFEYQQHQDQLASYQPGLSTQITSTEDIIQDTTQTTDDKTTIKEETLDTNDHTTNVAAPTRENDDNVLSTLPDITERLHIEKKVDLFKAIFDSSSESEGEEADPKETDLEEKLARENELKANILSDELVLPKIKPIKEGILSNLDFTLELNRNLKNIIAEETKQNEQSIVDNSYGPKLPGTVIIPKTICQIKIEESESDEWVEKDEIDKKKKSKHKKHKKDKYSHKKKHKHHRRSRTS